MSSTFRYAMISPDVLFGPCPSPDPNPPDASLLAVSSFFCRASSAWCCRRCCTTESTTPSIHQSRKKHTLKEQYLQYPGLKHSFGNRYCSAHKKHEHDNRSENVATDSKRTPSSRERFTYTTQSSSYNLLKGRIIHQYSAKTYILQTRQLTSTKTPRIMQTNHGNPTQHICCYLG